MDHDYAVPLQCGAPPVPESGLKPGGDPWVTQNATADGVFGGERHLWEGLVAMQTEDVNMAVGKLAERRLEKALR